MGAIRAPSLTWTPLRSDPWPGPGHTEESGSCGPLCGSERTRLLWPLLPTSEDKGLEAGLRLLWPFHFDSGWHPRGLPRLLERDMKSAHCTVAWLRWVTLVWHPGACSVYPRPCWDELLPSEDGTMTVGVRMATSHRRAPKRHACALMSPWRSTRPSRSPIIPPARQQPLSPSLS